MKRYLDRIANSHRESKSFKETNVRMNIMKIFMVGMIYTFFECIGLLLSTLGFFEHDIREPVTVIVIFHFVFLTFLAVSFKRKWFKRIGMYQMFTNIYIAVAMLWGSVFTILVYIEREDIAIFSIVLFFVAALFILEPNRSSLLYMTNYVIFTAMVYGRITSIGAANAIAFKSLITTVLALVISQGNYYSRKRLEEYKMSLEEANEQLKEQALRDSLTRLYNNRYMFELLTRETERFERSDGALSLIMLDIDDFKHVNDTYGHLFGDEVIRRVSSALMDSTRESDVIGRYGGEEFIVILKDTSTEKAVEIAERIRKTISDLEFDKAIKITASFGVSTLKDFMSTGHYEKDATKERNHGKDAAELVNIADMNLYKAKHRGKNCVVH